MRKSHGQLHAKCYRFRKCRRSKCVDCLEDKIDIAGAQMKLPNVENIQKYSSLTSIYFFNVVAIKTPDRWGQQTKEFISKIQRRPSTAQDDPKSALFLREKISVALGQRDNAARIEILAGVRWVFQRRILYLAFLLHPCIFPFYLIT